LAEEQQLWGTTVGVVGEEPHLGRRQRATPS
jgi:hypothetical protein